MSRTGIYVMGTLYCFIVYTLQMPKALRDNGWKVKIRNLERTEEPHVTILRRTTVWRYNIRETGFMDSEPDPRQGPDEVIEHIANKLKTLQMEWDKKHPENPIDSGDGSE